MNGQPRIVCPTCSAELTADARFCGGCGSAVSAPGVAAAADDLSGREIAGRYRLLQLLGAGGMGAVYRAEQISLKREVALKLLKSELSADPALVQRFNIEAKLAAKLSHPNTVTMFDFGQDSDGTLFIVMELVSGQSLRQLLGRDGALPVARALAICEQVCASLADAHAHGIVHRDLKPDNVMLTQRGKRTDVVRVLDFGIAKLRDERGDVTAMPVTQAGDLLGTPQYMAPEQIRGEAVDGRTDIYAMGAMLYEMLTGQLPFSGPTVMSILGKHLTDVPQPPRQRRPDLVIPPEIDALVMQALAKPPASRPPTMEEMAERVGRIRAALPPPSGAVIPRRTTRPPGVPLTVDTPMPQSAAGYAAPTPSPQPFAQPTPGAGTNPTPPPGPAYSPPPTGPGYAPPTGPGYAPPTGPGYAPPTGPGYAPPPTHAAPPPRKGLGVGLWMAIVLAGVAVLVVIAWVGTRSAKSMVASKTDQPTTYVDVGDLDIDQPGPAKDQPTGPGVPTTPVTGDRWEHPWMGYGLIVPPGFQDQQMSPALELFTGQMGGVPAVITITGEQRTGPVTAAEIDTEVQALLTSSNGTLVQRRTVTYQGKPRTSVIFDIPQQGVRAEMVLYEGENLLVGVAFGCAAGFFDQSADTRAELFERRVFLP